MARLWHSGFELQSMTALKEWDSVVGSPAIDTTIKRGGKASMRVNTAGTARYVGKQVQATGGTAVTRTRLWIYIASAPSADVGILDLGENTTLYDDGTAIILTTTRTLQFWDISGSAQIGADSSAIPLNEWHMIEIQQATDGDTVAARLDESQFATDTGLSGIVDSPSNAWVGILDASVTADIYFDDFAFNNSAGTVQNSWPGLGCISHLRPNNTGDSETAGIAKTGETPAWACMDEVTPDDATSYIAVAATTDTVYVNIQDPGEGNIGLMDTIVLCAVGFRFSATTAAACSINARLRSASGGATATSGNVTTAVTAWHTNDDVVPRNLKLVSYTDPTTGVAWTPEGTNSLRNAQIGLTSADATPDPLISAMWLSVEYIPASLWIPPQTEKPLPVKTKVIGY